MEDYFFVFIVIFCWKLSIWKDNLISQSLQAGSGWKKVFIKSAQHEDLKSSHAFSGHVSSLLSVCIFSNFSMYKSAFKWFLFPKHLTSISSWGLRCFLYFSVPISYWQVSTAVQTSYNFPVSLHPPLPSAAYDWISKLCCHYSCLSLESSDL